MAVLSSWNAVRNMKVGKPCSVLLLWCDLVPLGSREVPFENRWYSRCRPQCPLCHFFPLLFYSVVRDSDSWHVI